MSKQYGKPLSLPQHPTTDEHDAWCAYREEWHTYSDSWRTFWKSQGLLQQSEKEIDGWFTYHRDWLEHWKRLNQPWRTEPEIRPERQEELERCRAVVSDFEKGLYPFKGMKLDRADVEWLLATHGAGLGPVDWSDERQRFRGGLDLRGAELSHVNLDHLPLTRLEGGLSPRVWENITPQQQVMAAVLMEGADLRETQLEGTDLREVQLKGANLKDVVLGNEQHIGPQLANAQWGDTNLAVVNWSQVTMLGDEWEAWQKKKHKGMRLNECQTAVRANRQLASALQSQSLNEDAAHFAYRAQVLHRKVLWLQLVLQLVGLWEKVQGTRAWRFLVEVWQWFQDTQLWRLLVKMGWGIRKFGVWFHDIRLWRLLVKMGWGIRKFGVWFRGSWLWQLLVKVGRGIRALGVWLSKLGSLVFSLFLGVLAGYGYRPGRALIWYLFVIVGFTTAYSVFGHLPPLPDALVFSLMSFHGRGFFPSLSGETSLHNPLVVFAAAEAVVGLFIEISFIATFTQRFFGK